MAVLLKFNQSRRPDNGRPEAISLLTSNSHSQFLFRDSTPHVMLFLKNKSEISSAFYRSSWALLKRALLEITSNDVIFNCSQ